MNILVVWWRWPRPEISSGDRRFLELLRILASEHAVDYVVPLPGEGSDDRAGIDRLAAVGVRVLGDSWSAFSMALSRRFYHVVLFEFYHLFEPLAPTIRARQPHARLIVDSVDVHFARLETGTKVGAHASDETDGTRRLELAAYRAADAVIAVTDEDAQRLRDEAQMRPVFVVPNILSLRSRPVRDRRPSVLFIGGFRHKPNIDAVQWFANEVWPAVHSQVPAATFCIAGSHPTPEVLALAEQLGIEVKGFVPDTGVLLDDAAVSVAPLRFGAGMKGKVNEALAAGLPLVSTSFGVQGIRLTPGVHAYVTDDAGEFAEAVVRLLSNHEVAAAMGNAARTVAARFTPEQVALDIRQALAAIVPDTFTAGARLRWWVRNAGSLLSAVVRRVTAKGQPER